MDTKALERRINSFLRFYDSYAYGWWSKVSPKDIRETLIQKRRLIKALSSGKLTKDQFVRELNEIEKKMRYAKRLFVIASLDELEAFIKELFAREPTFAELLAKEEREQMKKRLAVLRKFLDKGHKGTATICIFVYTGGLIVDAIVSYNLYPKLKSGMQKSIERNPNALMKVWTSREILDFYEFLQDNIDVSSRSVYEKLMLRR